MIKHLCVAALAAICLTFATAADASTVICNKVVGNACIITGNGGGVATHFEHAAAGLKARGMRLIIDGPCDSACIQVLVPAMGSAACTTARASFVTHTGMTVLEKNFLNLPVYSGDEKIFGAARAVQAGLIAPCAGHQSLRAASTGHPAPRMTSRGTMVIAGCDPHGRIYHYRCW